MFKRGVRIHSHAVCGARAACVGLLIAWGGAAGCMSEGVSGLAAPASSMSTNTPSPPNPVPDPSPDGGAISPASVEDVPAPVSFEAVPVFCCNPLTLDFSAQLAADANAATASYTWAFGDDRTARGATAAHTFPQAGVYTVTLTARLTDGSTFVIDQSVSVGLPDANTTGTLAISAGTDQSVLSGAPVTLVGRVVDGDPNAAVTWRQRSGDRVALAGAHDPRASFVAPVVATEPLMLEFEFSAASTAPDTVRVTVWPTDVERSGNTAPYVYDAALTVARNETGTVVIRGVDFEGDGLAFSIATGPAHGSVIEIAASIGGQSTLRYTPDTDYAGPDSFTFTGSDGRNTSNIGTCHVTVTPGASDADAVDSEFLVAKDTPSRIILSGASGVGAVLAFRVTTPPLHGMLGAISSGSPDSAVVTYSPLTDFEGTDQFEFVVGNGVTESAPATITIQVKKLITPWLEVNAPTDLASNLYTVEQGAEPGMTMIDYCLAGLEHWSKITDTVFVSTMPGQSEHLYPELMRRKPPNLRIIGGIKTLRLPGGMPDDTRPYDFADAEAWAVIGAEAEDIVRYTGMTTVLLENETALGRYTFGEVSIDYARLYDSLSALRGRGVSYCWNLPRLLPDIPEFPNRLADSTAFVATIASALPDSLFLGGYTAWYDWQYQLELRDTMRTLVGDPRIQERLLVTPDGYHHLVDLDKRSFTPAEAIDRSVQLTGETANIYPGAENWVVVGESFSSLLPPLAMPVR